MNYKYSADILNFSESQILKLNFLNRDLGPCYFLGYLLLEREECENV